MTAMLRKSEQNNPPHTTPSQNLPCTCLGQQLFYNFFFFVFFFGSISYSQTSYEQLKLNRINSLKQELSKTIHDTLRVVVLNDIANEYRILNDLTLAEKHIDEAISIADTMEWMKGLCLSYNNLSYIKLYDGNHAQSMEYVLKALKIAESIYDEKNIAFSYVLLGNLNEVLASDNTALKNYFSALEIRKKLGDKTDIGWSYHFIGRLYCKQKKYEESFKFHTYALNVRTETHDYRSIADSYFMRGVTLLAQDNYNQSLTEFTEAKLLYEEIQDKRRLTELLPKIAKIYFIKKEYRNAENILLSVATIAKQINVTENLPPVYAALSKLYAEQHDYLLAYHYRNLYSELTDSVYEVSIKSSKTMSEQIFNFNKEKEEKIKRLEQEKKDEQVKSEKLIQKVLLFSVTSVLVLVIVFMFNLWKRWQVIKKQKALIEKQNIEIAGKNQNLTDSILYAERIQKAILTSAQNLNEMFAAYFILYKPKDIVAGDFYWAYSKVSAYQRKGVRESGNSGGAALQHPDTRCYWMVADCTGHGVPGAFMSMIGNSLLNEIVVEKGIEEPANILNQLRDGIIKSMGQSGNIDIKEGIDCALCCWNKTTNKLTFAGAYNACWIVRKTTDKEQQTSDYISHSGATEHLPDTNHYQLIELEPDYQPVGTHQGKTHPFSQKEFQLQKDDTIYIFSDGYTDQFGGPKEKKFMTKRFRKLILSVQDKTMPEQLNILDKTITEWMGSLMQLDDICVFGARV